PWQPFRRYERVHGKDSHFWFRTRIEVPEAVAERNRVEVPEPVPEGEYALRLTTGAENGWDATNPQGLLYLDGEIACGLDVNHRECVLEAGRSYEVLLYFYTGMNDAYVDVLLDIVKNDKRVRRLYYDLKVPYDAAMCLPEEDYDRIRILRSLEAACNIIDFRKRKSEMYFESLERAERYLKEEFYEKECGDSRVIVDYIGHTHIDVAWLWTLEQTREKVQRTFATVLELMDRYPQYIFFSSQPQLFAYLKEEEPALYERVRERIREGRFEVEGAMWLEADCNLSSGESLVRQIVHGKRFMKQEFGVESHILWLPDVFGYSAALPQILQKSGVDRFVTSKISWNETDKLPYDSFYWQGIDGTEVFTYFMTARDYNPLTKNDNTTTYNGDVTPKMNLGTWMRYQQKEYNDDVLVTFGYGDGGGGPTAEMLEREERLEYGLPGQPKARMSRASDFLDRVEKNLLKNAELLRRMPRWVGELYLEKHRGTYTSQARNKRNNRKSEQLLESAESLSAVAKLLFNREYPAELYYKNWETVCLNQFHDIIPGSSIHEVYEHCERDYAVIRQEVGQALSDTLQALAGQVSAPGYLVYNPNGFVFSQQIETPEGIIYAENIPVLGYRVIPIGKQGKNGSENVFPPNAADAAEGFRFFETEKGRKGLQTPFYKVEFNEALEIDALYDVENGRYVNAPGGTLNRLRAYENYPYDYDNWEISNYYETKFWDVTDVTACETCISGEGKAARAEIRITRRYMDSEIRQTIRFYAAERRIDFITEADW
ncbi:MAG: alpha-mannosidase, partial [Lachnospiraceae bacterium]|nr:alpha-mannosidase [Lachnospiraceae bacterium]